MAIQELNEATFADVVGAEGITLVDWWAPWCGPCRAFAPVYEKASESHEDVTFAKVNTEDAQGLAAAFGIRAIPTLMVFRDGVLLLAQPGMVPEAALHDVIAQAQALDMDEVRAEVAAKQAEREAAASA